jgi:asparagine synthase (glutamine-hydrolysing)
MCGFGGVARFGAPIDHQVLRGFGDSLFHRGPDQGGFYTVGGPPFAVGVATRRLSILDLSPAGDQPMATEDGAIWIAYNGELYNDAALRLELAARGVRFRSQSDTETVLYAYQEFGLDCLRRLNGMFALAIHDRRSGRLVLARDRMGIKPLYYAWDGAQLSFASELRTLVRAAAAPPAVDAEALDLYLALGFVPSPHCLVAGVRKLPPGSYLVLDAGAGDAAAGPEPREPQAQRFWTLAYPAAATLSQENAALTARAAVEDAVGRQMRSDVPVGILLSGGLDSTIIAAAAAPRTARPLDTFSIVFGGESSPIGQEYNADAAYARRVAAALGARHHDVVCDERNDLPGLLRRLVVALDEPVWELSFASIYLMSALAREQGVKVLLTGDGSDELFAGYPWTLAAERQARYERLPFGSSLLRLATQVLPAGSTLRQHALNQLALNGATPLQRYEHRSAIFDAAERRALTGRATNAGGPGAPGDECGPLAGVVAPLLAGVQGRSRGDEAALLDLGLWVREHFNQRIDRMTMLASVEARVPFQDNAVVDLALRLPVSVKARGGRSKAILRDAFRDSVPAFVLDRSKRPFAAPQWAWGAGVLRDFVHETLSPHRLRTTGVIAAEPARAALGATQSARQDRRTFKLWTLLMLQLWIEELVCAGPGRQSAGIAESVGALGPLRLGSKTEQVAQVERVTPA